MRKLLVITMLLELMSFGNSSPQGYGGLRPAPAPSYPQPQATCQPVYTTTTVFNGQYVTLTSFRTQYQTKYQTQYVTETKLVTNMEQVQYVTHVVPSYVTQTVTQHCGKPGGVYGSSSIGGYGGSAGGYGSNPIDVRVRNNEVVSSGAGEGAWQWSP